MISSAMRSADLRCYEVHLDDETLYTHGDKFVDGENAEHQLAADALGGARR
jgi:hypothetical protein